MHSQTILSPPFRGISRACFPIRSSYVGIRTIRYLQGSKKRVARRSTRPPWDFCSNLRHGIAPRASCKQHLNKASNYKHVLPSQLAGLAGGKSFGSLEIWSSIANDFLVPLKCTTRVCGPLHIGELCIAKAMRVLLDSPHHTLLLPPRLQLRLVRTAMAAYGASIGNALTCLKWKCNATGNGVGNCWLSSVCLEWNRRLACKCSH